MGAPLRGTLLLFLCLMGIEAQWNQGFYSRDSAAGARSSSDVLTMDDVDEGIIFNAEAGANGGGHGGGGPAPAPHPTSSGGQPDPLDCDKIMKECQCVGGGGAKKGNGGRKGGGKPSVAPQIGPSQRASPMLSMGMSDPEDYPETY